MPDFNIEDKVKNGLKFRDIFRSLILYSISLFIAFWWADFMREVMAKILPEGQSLMLKAGIGFMMTIVLVIFAWLLLKTRREKK